LPQVVLPEDNQATHPLGHLVRPIDRSEVARAQVVGHRRERGGRVDTAPGERDGVRVQVGGDQAHCKPLQLVAQRLGDQDRQGVRFLAGGAAGRPQPQLVPMRACVGDQLRQRVVAQFVEEGSVAEELGHVDQEGTDEPAVLRGMAVQVGAIGREGAHAGGGDAPLQAAQDRGRLVLGEVETLSRPYLGQHGRQRLLLRRGALPVRAARRWRGAGQEIA